MADALQFIDERINDSITARIPVDNPVDTLQPLTFTEWLKRNTELLTTTGDFLTRYQSYLTNWYAAKDITKQEAVTEIQKYYTNLINDIVINYTTTDEKRYLKNIDISNNRDLAIAVPFFAKKIKDICIYYSTLRDDVQTSALSFNLKGSNTGIADLIYVNLTKALQAQDIVDLFSTLNLSLTDVRNNIVIDVEDLYDTYADYYDLSPTLPASAYDTNTGLRNDYFNLNQNDVDPYLFGNFDQSILRSILSYPFYLIELDGNFTIDPLVNSSQLNLLKDSDFISTVNDGDVNNLNLVNKSQEITKYIGSDFYYIVTDTTTAFTSGQLFTADTEFANYLNKRYPSIAAVPSEEFLKTGYELGLFFKPDKIGLANFTNFKFTSFVNVDALSPDTVYYFPDPAKYGNISGNTKLEFKSPLTFFEENYFNKTDYSNQYKFGDASTDPYFQTFRAYQSREQTLNHTNFGVSRYIDSQDFFTGSQDTLWSNPDVYPLELISQYPIDLRQSNLLTLNKTLFQYKGDVYGNEYALYKSVSEMSRVSDISRPRALVNYIFDGYTFFDSLCGQGYNFNYTVAGTASNGKIFSGVVLNTSVSEPASFSDGGNPTIITSYDFASNFLYEDLFEDFVTTTYTCTVKDGLYFTKNNNGMLPDVPSDIVSYNPNTGLLYYNELTDGAPAPNAPYGVGTFTYQPDFSLDALSYNGFDYDGNVFYIDSLDSEPCTLDSYTHSYTEPSNFKDIRQTGYETVLDTSINTVSTKKPLYYTRAVEYGDLYFRNANSTAIGPASATLSAALLNYPQNIKEEIYNKLINFEVYYDVLQLETENYLIFDRLQFDYNTNSITGSVNEFRYFNRGELPDLERFSNVWFNESDNTLMFCKTTLLRDSLSASNYKVVYPTIYRINLNNQQISEIYPAKAVSDLVFNDLSVFSLYGKGIELNIVEIEKPVFNFSPETGYYTLTYLGKDTADCFYIITTRFRYVNNTVQNITCTLHTPVIDVYDITFGNPQGSPYLETYTTLGSAAGYFNATDNTFTFGYDVTA